MEADDAMAALLAGYFSEEDTVGADEDAEDQDHETSQDPLSTSAVQDSVHSLGPSTGTTSLATTALATCDLAMYSDDSEDEEPWTGGGRACGGG